MRYLAVLIVAICACSQPTGIQPPVQLQDLEGEYAGKDLRMHDLSCEIVLSGDDAYSTGISFHAVTDSSWTWQDFTLTSAVVNPYSLSFAADTVAETGATVHFFAEYQQDIDGFTGYHLAVWTTGERDSVAFTMNRLQ